MGYKVVSSPYRFFFFNSLSAPQISSTQTVSYRVLNVEYTYIEYVLYRYNVNPVQLFGAFVIIFSVVVIMVRKKRALYRTLYKYAYITNKYVTPILQ